MEVKRFDFRLRPFHFLRITWEMARRWISQVNYRELLSKRLKTTEPFILGRAGRITG
jgi:hypothetical protein